MADEEKSENREEENLPGADERDSHKPSDLDAIGHDKRRQVVGGQYGATVRKQLTVYGIFIAVVAAIVIAGLTVVRNIDNREIPLEDTGPWTEADAAQVAPRPIDYLENGPTNTIPRNEIDRAVSPAVSDADTGN